MSEYWGLRCKQCGIESEHDFNHGERVMQGLISAWPHIKAAKAADKSGYLEFHLMGHDGSVIEFAEEHYEHGVEPCNEYGENIEERDKRQAQRR